MARLLLVVYLCLVCWLGLWLGGASAQGNFPTIRPTRSRRPTHPPTFAPTILPYSVRFTTTYGMELQNTKNLANSVISSVAQDVEVLGILSNAACQTMSISNVYCLCGANCLQAVAVHTEAVTDTYALASTVSVEILSGAFPQYRNNPQGLYNLLKQTWDSQVVADSKVLLSSLRAYDNQLFANVTVASTAISAATIESYGSPTYSPNRGPSDDDAAMSGMIAGSVIGGIIVVGACFSLFVWFRYVRINYQPSEMTKELTTQIAAKSVNPTELLALGEEIKVLKRKETMMKLKSAQNMSFYRMSSSHNMDALQVDDPDDEHKDAKKDFGLQKLERIKSLVQEARTRVLDRKESMTPMSRRKSVRFEADDLPTVRMGGSEDEYDGKILVTMDDSKVAISPERLDMLITGRSPKAIAARANIKGTLLTPPPAANLDSDLESRMSSVTGDESENDRLARNGSKQQARASFFEKYNPNAIHGESPGLSPIAFQQTPLSARSDYSESTAQSGASNNSKLSNRRPSFMQQRDRYMDNGSESASVLSDVASEASARKKKAPARASLMESLRSPNSINSHQASDNSSMGNVSLVSHNEKGETHDALYKGSTDRVVMSAETSSMMNGLRKLGQNKDYRASFYEKYNFQKVASSDTESLPLDRKKSADNKDFEQMVQAKHVLAMESRSFDDLDFSHLNLKRKMSRKASMERLFVANNTSDCALDKHSQLAVQSSLLASKEMIRSAMKTPRKTTSKRNVAIENSPSRRVSFSPVIDDSTQPVKTPVMTTESLLRNIKLSKTPSSFHEHVLSSATMSELSNSSLWREEELVVEVGENLIEQIDDEYRTIHTTDSRDEYRQLDEVEEQTRSKQQDKMSKFHESIKAASPGISIKADSNGEGQTQIERLPLTMEEVMSQLIALEGDDSAIFALPENVTLS